MYDDGKPVAAATTGTIAIVRLGTPGIIHGIIVDTAYFKGNYPPFVSVEAASIEGYPSVEEIMKADWQTVVEKSPAEGHTANAYGCRPAPVDSCATLDLSRRWGREAARTRRVVPDPRFLDGTLDLLAAENGGRLVGCSDAFYASPANIILPGRARNMGEGWENARRRGGGNDFAVFALAAAGRPRNVEIDTSYYVGNAPGWVRLSAIDARSADIDDDSAWTELMPRTAVQPDTRHRFVLDAAGAAHIYASTSTPTADCPACACSVISTSRPWPTPAGRGGTPCRQVTRR